MRGWGSNNRVTQPLNFDSGSLGLKIYAISKIIKWISNSHPKYMAGAFKGFEVRAIVCCVLTDDLIPLVNPSKHVKNSAHFWTSMPAGICLWSTSSSSGWRPAGCYLLQFCFQNLQNKTKTSRKVFIIPSRLKLINVIITKKII